MDRKMIAKELLGMAKEMTAESDASRIRKMDESLKQVAESLPKIGPALRSMEQMFDKAMQMRKANDLAGMYEIMGDMVNASYEIEAYGRDAKYGVQKAKHAMDKQGGFLTLTAKELVSADEDWLGEMARELYRRARIISKNVSVSTEGDSVVLREDPKYSPKAYHKITLMGGGKVLWEVFGKGGLESKSVLKQDDPLRFVSRNFK